MRSKTLRIAFYVAFALWFTAVRYSEPAFYGWLIAPAVETALVWGVIALFVAVVFLAVRSAIRRGSFPWGDAIAAGLAFLSFELLWRVVLSRTAWDAFKLTSVTLDILTPAIAAVGIVVVIGQLQSQKQLVSS